MTGGPAPSPDTPGAAGRPGGSALGIASVLLALSYPLLAHLAITLASPALALAGAGVMVAVVLMPALRAGHPAAWLAALAAALALAVLARLELQALPLYAPPVLLNAWVAWLFGRTLRGGRTPLIGRVVLLLRGPQALEEPGVARYARRLTLLWTLLLAGLALVNLVLALLAQPGGLLATAGVDPGFGVPQSAWSWFANVFNYVLVALLLALEFALRRRLFPSHDHRSFAQFGRRMAGMWPQLRQSMRDD